ncbi:thioesterase II family protein [Caldimonas brevitalea]|uniref:Thioesterase n=1 Tax=Caldimonas brevitalea TaxID=413882 RepID=A0A0G3BQ43_9BURK|nr:alpha/beta fold hydrolase [Caldimonas brevitalea]AKJ29471.1 thioesterase [Caldimonas brevitalea]
MSSPWFALQRGRGASPRRLYCVPYAGAGHTVYRHWRALLNDDIELALVKLPGRADRYRDPRPDQLVDVAAQLADAVAEAQAAAPAQPYALFGHSMGALIAFEAARRLAYDHGVPPAALFVSGRRAPSLPQRAAPVSGAGDAELLRYVRSLGGFPDALLEHPEVTAFFLAGLRADFAWCETHRHVEGQRLPCPLTVYTGAQDPGVPTEDCAAWAACTDAAFALRCFPGGHFFLFQHEAQVLEDLQRRWPASARNGAPGDFPAPPMDLVHPTF